MSNLLQNENLPYVALGVLVVVVVYWMMKRKHKKHWRQSQPTSNSTSSADSSGYSSDNDLPSTLVTAGAATGAASTGTVSGNVDAFSATSMKGMTTVVSPASSISKAAYGGNYGNSGPGKYKPPPKVGTGIDYTDHESNRYS